MSIKKKQTVKFTALALIFILSVTYFSLLSPTSAYFYKSEDRVVEVEFASFDVSQTVFAEEDELFFKAATKFHDFDELLFDDVAETKTITVTNTGEADARIYARVTPDAESIENGFMYMIEMGTINTAPEETETDAASLAEDGTTEETTASSKVEKGILKSEIEGKLNLTSTMSEEEAIASLNSYNNESEAEYVLLSTGESVDVTIVCWSQYTNIEENLKNTDTISKIPYNCAIEIIATQDNDAAVPQ